MSSIHILGVEIASSAVIRVLAAYLLFYALTRLASSASLRHALWVVFVGASLCYWVAVLMQLMNLPPAVKSTFSAGISSLPTGPASPITILRIPLSWNWIVSPAITCISWIYVVCAAVMLIRIVRRRAELHQAVSQAQPAALELQAVFQNACAHLQVSKCQILEASGLTSPGTAYAWNPVVILPAGVDAYLDKEQLVDVLYHELTHVKRLDFLWSTFAEVAACLLFFHPAVWLALRNLARERELACDMTVMDLRRGRRQDYAHCLTRLARRQILGAQVAPPKHLALLNSFLAYRVKTLLAERQRRRPVIRATAVVAGFGAVVIFAVGWSLLGLAVELEHAVPRVIAVVPSLDRPTARATRVRRRSASLAAEGGGPRASDYRSEAVEIAAQTTVFRFSPVDPSLDGGENDDDGSDTVNALARKAPRAGENNSSTSTPGHNSPSWQKTAANAAIGALSRIAADKRDNDGDADDRTARPF